VFDARWWKGVVQKWEDDTHGGIEYPILSVEELLANPAAIHVVQSDASGEDGFGYFYGDLGDEEASFVARQWEGNAELTDEWYNDPLQWTTSHDSEMKGLLHFVQDTDKRNVMLIWVSDCLSAVWSVNKGRCREALGLITLTEILGVCDEKRLLIVALWVPRELNAYADYLSHLTAYLGRSEVRGTTCGLRVPGASEV
jgi:hypothetical protein